MSGISVGAHPRSTTSRPAIIKRTMSSSPIAIIEDLTQSTSYEKGLWQASQGYSASPPRGTVSGDSDTEQHMETIERIARVFSRA